MLYDSKLETVKILKKKNLHFQKKNNKVVKLDVVDMINTRESL